jgi:hypothetical protein
MNDEERQAQGKFVSTIVNACQEIIREGDIYLNVLGKLYMKEPEKTTVSEKNFDLTYTKHTGAKLGEFEIADEKDSPSDLYKQALNILKQNGATISKRYHGDGYFYSYWE